MKTCSLAGRKIAIKTTVAYHCAPTSMAKRRNREKHWCGPGRTGFLIFWWEWKNGTALLENRACDQWLQLTIKFILTQNLYMDVLRLVVIGKYWKLARSQPTSLTLWVDCFQSLLAGDCDFWDRNGPCVPTLRKLWCISNGKKWAVGTQLNLDGPQGLYDFWRGWQISYCIYTITSK